MNFDDLKIAPPTITRTENSVHVKGDPLTRDKLRVMGALLRALDKRDDAPHLDVVTAADVTAQPVEWLWPNRIALGKLTLLAGVPGLGKSQLAAFLAACVTNNRALPAGEGSSPQGSVIILSAEDDLADTIRPRLDAAGANCGLVDVVGAVTREKRRRGFNLQADLDLLETMIKQADAAVRLIVIDPIASYLGRVDSHKNAEVRSVLEPLGALAARHKAAVLAITHFSKGTAARALDRVVGSIAFVAAARSALMIVKDPADSMIPKSGDRFSDQDHAQKHSPRRLMVTLKSNVAEEAAGLAFRIRGTITGNVPTSVLEWEEGRIEGSADEVLAKAREAEQGKSARAEAEEFLRKVLGQDEIAVGEVKVAAAAVGVSWSAVRRTHKEIGVVVRRRSNAGDKHGAGWWAWSLPPQRA